MLQLLPAGIVAPTTLIPVAPVANAAPAAFVIVPPQVFIAIVVSAKTIAPGVVGKLSVNVALMAAVLVGLFNVIVSTLLTFEPTTAGKNDLLITGEVTSKSALVETALVPPELVRAPAGIKLV